MTTGNNGNNAAPRQGVELSTKPIEVALEWSKQITTLATGTLVLSATFIQMFFKHALVQKGWLLFSWILLGVSILCGVLYLGALCSTLAAAAKNPNATAEDLDIYNQPGLCIAIFHVFTFLAGLAVFIYFVFANL